jgi:hypothetical protein
VPVVILVHQCGFKAKSKPVPMELAELRLLGMETVPL